MMRRSKVNIFQQFKKKNQEKQKKMTEKREFLRKTSFRLNRFFIWLIKNTTLSFPYIFLQVISRRYLKILPLRMIHTAPNILNEVKRMYWFYNDMCFFVFFFVFVFVSVYSITSRNNAPISNYGGGFLCKNEYPWCIIEVKS
ncbi:Uncharacterized protein FWK35_00011400, partial [Aphis craccivora]